MPPNATQPVAEDDAILGALLVAGEVPADLRRAVRPALFTPERRPMLERILSCQGRFDYRALLSEFGDPTALEARYTLAAAFPDQLPLYLRILELRQQQEEVAFKPATIVPLSAVLADLERDLRAGVQPHVVPTPFPGLNRMFGGGLSPGELMFVAARAGTGKTAFALELARKAAESGEQVLIVSREMKNRILGTRMLSQKARVAALSLTRRKLGAGEWVLLDPALKSLSALPVWLTDDALTIPQIEGALTDAVPPIGLLIVDYLQLLRAPLHLKERRHQVEAVSQGLKALAMDHNMPVVCVSAISRTPGGPEEEPTMQSLRESGELEHTADLILLLARKFKASKTKCIVAKNRNGREGSVPLQFRAEYVALEEEEGREEDA
jgi:replicative DNA helicase